MWVLCILNAEKKIKNIEKKMYRKNVTKKGRTIYIRRGCLSPKI